MYLHLVVNGDDAKERAHATIDRLDYERLHSVVVKPFKPPRTEKQNKTLWKWHGEVAAELSTKTNIMWTPEHVHDFIFIPKFMPIQTIEIDGEEIVKPLRTSDMENNREIMTEAMEAYMAWCYEHGIEITVPENHQ